MQFNTVQKSSIKVSKGTFILEFQCLKKKLLNKNFKNFKNFEMLFYPPLIKNNRTAFEEINGFWHSIDNYKDVDDVNNKKK